MLAFIERPNFLRRYQIATQARDRDQLLDANIVADEPLKIFQREIFRGENIFHQGVQRHRVAAVQRPHSFGGGLGHRLVADLDA